MSHDSANALKSFIGSSASEKIEGKIYTYVFIAHVKIFLTAFIELSASKKISISNPDASKVATLKTNVNIIEKGISETPSKHNNEGKFSDYFPVYPFI